MLFSMPRPFAHNDRSQLFFRHLSTKDVHRRRSHGCMNVVVTEKLLILPICANIEALRLDDAVTRILCGTNDTGMGHRKSDVLSYLRRRQRRVCCNVSYLDPNSRCSGIVIQISNRNRPLMLIFRVCAYAYPGLEILGVVMV